MTSLALLCTAQTGHQHSVELRALGECEEELIGAGDVAGAIELHADTWLGPEADEATREKLRQMQGRNLEVQLAAEEFESIKAEIDPADITATSLLISGRHDLGDFRQIAAHLTGQVPNARHIELSWAGHLPSLERPNEVNWILIDFLHETLAPR